MASIAKRLKSLELVPGMPHFVPDNVQYEVIVGSMAYGVSTDTSDMDVYGFCVPPRHIVFPHENGVIHGFDEQVQGFAQYMQHGIIDKDARKEYDLTIFNIVKYFKLCMQNNPNMIDSLFVPQTCVLHATRVGQMVREQRKLFLHKGAWHRFKGYAFSQMKKMKTKNPEGKRKAMVEEFGYDVKFAYHVVRLLNEVEQILTEHDIDLQRNREQLKSIRRGEWKLEDIERHFADKELELEKMYLASTLQYGPDVDKLKQLLIDCLEQHYGSLGNAVVVPGRDGMILNDLEALLRRYRS